MKFDINVRQVVEIPDANLLELAASVRDKRNMTPDEPVSNQELIDEAIAQGLIDEIDGSWSVEDDEYFTDDELAENATVSTDK